MVDMYELPPDDNHEFSKTKVLSKIKSSFIKVALENAIMIFRFHNGGSSYFSMSKNYDWVVQNVGNRRSHVSFFPLDGHLEIGQNF